MYGAQAVNGMFAGYEYKGDDNIYANVVVDSKTGDFLNLEKYDYQVEGQARDYGEEVPIADGINAHKGYTKSELYKVFKDNGYVTDWDEKGEPKSFKTPVSMYTHVALSHDDAVRSGLAKELPQNDDGSYENAQFESTIVTSGCATAATPTKNINFHGNITASSIAPTWLFAM